MCRILIIGCGYWGKNWYNTIKRTRELSLSNGKVVNVSIAGVVDPNPVIEIEEPCFSTIGEVDVDYTHAIVATQAELHLSVFEKLATKILPRNILIEKPCGIDLMQRLSLSKAFPGYIFLSSPQYHVISRMLIEKKLGRVFYANFERASMGPRIRTDVDIVDDYMIHDIYLYVSLFCQVGEFALEDFKVYGSMQHNFNSHIKPDTAFFTVIKDDVTVNFFSSWNYPQKHRKITIVGEKGSITWDGDRVLYNRSRYEAIDGYDQHRNPNYQLNQLDCEDVTPLQELDNLQLQLRSFLEQRRRDVCMKNTSYLVDFMKESAYISKK